MFDFWLVVSVIYSVAVGERAHNHHQEEEEEEVEASLQKKPLSLFEEGLVCSKKGEVHMMEIRRKTKESDSDEESDAGQKRVSVKGEEGPPGQDGAHHHEESSGSSNSNKQRAHSSQDPTPNFEDIYGSMTKISSDIRECEKRLVEEFARLKHRAKELEEEQKKWEIEKQKVDGILKISRSKIKLNVGGKTFVTSLDTLTAREPDSFFGCMFSGRFSSLLLTAPQNPFPPHFSSRHVWHQV